MTSIQTRYLFDMSDPCVIQADYVNWRTVVGRKALQLIFEIDISLQGEVLKMLGAPASDKSVPCAIALLNTERAPVAGNGKPDLQAPGDSPPTLSGGVQAKKWSEYSRSQQAAILCGDPDFQRYFGAKNEKEAATSLRFHFRIKSRSELDAFERITQWDEFVALYHMHRDKFSPLRGAK